MHSVIRVIVYANDKEEGLNKAKDILENLCGEKICFDYFTTFDDDTSEMSGKGRWGEKPIIALANSKEGKKLIDEGMQYTKDSFMEQIKKIRTAISKYSDEELFDGEIKEDKSKVVNKIEGNNDGLGLTDFRYNCYCLGQYRGSEIFLYDNDGEGIRNEKTLKSVLNKWNSKDYEGMKVYVIPADVHY